eukprot:TRINITY_DN34662_c0_g1_i1.p1 TRINITY_DN34662_c0_g1~~TRINITY_DN34662_c0_g1_i1.p1  ORF type:complete len:492 (+),score=124.91 TRINITY_DN34662_c0_g1_i1:30-1505(+)
MAAADHESGGVQDRILADFSFGDFLGVGSFCQVVKCLDGVSGKQYAAKRVTKKKDGTDQAIVMEVHCLRRLEDTRSVISLFYEFDGPVEWVGILECCEGGELWSEVDSCGCTVKGECAWYATQMVEALATVHEAGIVHRDLKCENFLITLPERQLKLIDFGTARDVEHPEVKTMMLGPQYEHHVGTPNFMSPEAVNGQANDRRSDLWSLGSTIAQLLLGAPPFNAQTPFLVLTKASSGNLWLPESGISSEEASLIRELLQKDPEKRLGSADTRKILEHKLLAGTPLKVPVHSTLSAALRLVARAITKEVAIAVEADEAAKAESAWEDVGAPPVELPPSTGPKAGEHISKLLDTVPGILSDEVGDGVSEKLLTLLSTALDQSKQPGCNPADFGRYLAKLAEVEVTGPLSPFDLSLLKRFGEMGEQKRKEAAETMDFGGESAEEEEESDEGDEQRDCQNATSAATGKVESSHEEADEKLACESATTRCQCSII